MLSVEDMCWLLISYWQPGKKMSFDKSLNIRAKSWKITLNPEGCSYSRLYKQGNESRKMKKIANNKHLSLITYTYPSNDVPRALFKLIIWQTVV